MHFVTVCAYFGVGDRSPLNGTVSFRKLATTKVTPRSSSGYFCGGVPLTNFGLNRIRYCIKPSTAHALQRCSFSASWLSASTPKPLSVGKQRRAHLILFILQLLPFKLRFSVPPFALTSVHCLHLAFKVTMSPALVDVHYWALS